MSKILIDKYFVIPGRNKQLSLYEINKIFGDIVVEKYEDFFVLKKLPKKIWKLSTVVKYWQIISLEDLEDYLKINDYKYIWTNDENLAKMLKSKWLVKKYKVYDILHSHQQIKKSGVEILNLGNKYLGIVLGWQNIKIYEVIDYERPVRSMKIWMMPAKLTHFLLNISTKLEENKVIYDPFAWLGTTIFVADCLWYKHIFWSDINISPAKQNLKWWLQIRKILSIDWPVDIYLFKQDVKKNLKNFIINKVTNIVTEWYLGPIVRKNLSFQEAKQYEKIFQDVFLSFLKNAHQIRRLENISTVLPVYFLKNNEKYIFEETIKLVKQIGYNVQLAPQIYYRKWQKLGRFPVLITKS